MMPKNMLQRTKSEDQQMLREQQQRTEERRVEKVELSRQENSLKTKSIPLTVFPNFRTYFKSPEKHNILHRKIWKEECFFVFSST